MGLPAPVVQGGVADIRAMCLAPSHRLIAVRPESDTRTAETLPNGWVSLWTDDLCRVVA